MKKVNKQTNFFWDDTLDFFLTGTGAYMLIILFYATVQLLVVYYGL